MFTPPELQERQNEATCFLYGKKRHQLETGSLSGTHFSINFCGGGIKLDGKKSVVIWKGGFPRKTL